MSYPVRILTPQSNGRNRLRVHLYSQIESSKSKPKTFYIVDLVRMAWGAEVADRLVHLKKLKPGRKASA